jgi:hypothetical protein
VPSPTATTRPSSTDSNAPLPLHVDGTQLKDSSGTTVILRGFDYGNMRWDGDATSQCTEQQIVYMKNAGANSVLIEVWAPYVISQGDEIFSDSGFWSRLDNIIAWATEQGMYVVLDGFVSAGPCLDGQSTNDLTHYFSTYDTWSNYVSYWRNYANRYKGYGNVIYQLTHEPLNCDSNVYSLRMQQAIDAIRVYDSDAVCVIQPVSTQADFNYGVSVGNEWYNGAFWFQQTNPINRPNIAFSFDPYGYWRYPDNSMNAISSVFNDIGATWLHKNNYCVFLCETGGNLEAAYTSWDITWNKNMMSYCDSNGYSGYHFYEWNTGSGDGVLANWNGGLNAYGTDVSKYFKTH